MLVVEAHYVVVGRPNVLLGPALVVELGLVALAITLAWLWARRSFRAFAFVGIAIMLGSVGLAFLAPHTGISRRYAKVKVVPAVPRAPGEELNTVYSFTPRPFRMHALRSRE